MMKDLEIRQKRHRSRGVKAEMIKINLRVLGMSKRVIVLCITLVLAICNLSFAEGVRVIGVEQLPKNEFLSVNKAASGNSAALFVGVNEFNKDAGLASLNCAVNDAVEQAHLFVRELKLIPAQNCILCISGSPSTAIAAKQLELLRKDGVEVRTAAKSDILNGLTIATRMPISTRDLVIVSVSSHGFEDKDGIYVMPADGLRSYLPETAVLSRVLTDTISKSRAGKKIVILDACRERVEKSKSSGSGFAMTGKFLRAFAAGRGQITLTSCGIGQFSYEDEKNGHGVFTSFLLKGLRGSASSDDSGFVTVGSLSQYVADGVRRWIVRNKPDVGWNMIPQPRLDASETARMMPLAIAGNISGEKLEKARKYWKDYSIAENPDISTDLQNPDSKNRDFEVVENYYLDGRIEKKDYELSKVLLHTETQYLDETEKELISVFNNVISGWQEPERLSRLLGLIEGYADRDKRKYAVLKRIEIAELLSDDQSNDKDANGKKVFSLFQELIQLAPSSSQIQVLRKKISGYYGPPPGDIITNSVGMKLVWIPAGDFLMGSSLSESQVVSEFGGKTEHFADEHPQHMVKLSKGFYISIYEVTQAHYRSVIGTNPSVFKGDNNPVEKVNWNDATEFCKKLSQKENGRTYTLPTEAQWEYSCRAGSRTLFSFGNSKSSLDDYAWHPSISGSKTHSIGQKKPNAFGLYDMHGNVWEWCRDYYSKDFYSESQNADPENIQSDRCRVLRGGSWRGKAYNCRSASRIRSFSDDRTINYGFRVVIEEESKISGTEGE